MNEYTQVTNQQVIVPLISMMINCTFKYNTCKSFTYVLITPWYYDSLKALTFLITDAHSLLFIVFSPSFNFHCSQTFFYILQPPWLSYLSYSFWYIVQIWSGPCSKLNPHLQLWKCQESNLRPHDQ